VLLPDGAITLSYNGQSGVPISYLLGSPYQTRSAFLTDPQEYVVFTASGASR
jgi:hypothetical protein